MRSYEVARNVFSFMSVCAWGVIGLGVIVAFGAGAAIQTFGGNTNPLQFAIAAMPGLLISVAGLYGLAFVQNARTSVDTAEYAQQSLNISRQQLEISKQVLELSRSKAATYAGTVAQKTVGASVAEPAADAASYANQPATAQPVPDTTSAPKGLPEPMAAVAAIAASTASDIPLPPSEIIYKDGLFSVGGESFKTKGDAIAHREKIAVPPPEPAQT